MRVISAAIASVVCLAAVWGGSPSVIEPSSPKISVLWNAGAMPQLNAPWAAYGRDDTYLHAASPVTVMPPEGRGDIPKAFSMLAAGMTAPVIALPAGGAGSAVNVASDGVDGDISDCICDTGNADSGFTDICTLRAAIQTNNECQTGIGFIGSFQGAGAIKPESQLPAIIGPVTIDGLGQQVEIDGGICVGCTRGLEVNGNGTITALVIYGFSGFQLVLSDGNGSSVSGNIINTDPSLTPPGAVDGVRLTGCNACTVQHNIVAGVIQFDGSGSMKASVLNNHVGVGPLGQDLGFGSIDFQSGGGNHTVRGNFVASDGFHIRLFGPDTGHSLIEENRVGTDPQGTISLGGSDGIELRSHFNTVRDNLVSGNGGNGISVVSGAKGNVIEFNRVGTSPAGTTPIGNGLVGVRLSGSGGENVVRANLISGNGAEGIYSNFSGDHNQFLFNLVGTDISGGMAVGNALAGIRFTTGFVTVQGNVVSGNGSFGIRAEGAAGGHTIVDNRVGTDQNGTTAVPNFDSGIRVTAPDVLVTQNLVSGNGGAPLGGHGIVVETINATAVEVSHNRVGVSSGGAPLGNVGRGIFITIGAHDNVVGPGNVIAHNGDDGLAVGSGISNELTANAIYENVGLGIDLGIDGPTANDAGDGDAGPNDFQNTPILTAINPGLDVNGTLESRPNRSYRIEIFSNQSCDPSGVGEGKTLIAETQVDTDGTGHADFSVPFPLNAANPTATATDLVTFDTSEFAPCIVYEPPVTGPINSVGDADDQTADDGICFTGNSIMRNGIPEDECTLRAAIETGHDAGGTKLLVFNIPPEQFPGDPLPIIRPETLLPSITEPLVIDGSSQPEVGKVAVSGSADAPAPLATRGVDGGVCDARLARLYQLDGSGADIRDHILYCADVAVSITGAGNSVFRNLIADSGTGVLVTGMPATGNDIFDNTIIRNVVGVGVQNSASDNIVVLNLIGTNGSGGNLGNEYGVYILNSGGNAVDDNTVVDSKFVGITLEDQGDGSATTGNHIRANRIGTDNLGRMGLGNGSFGLWIHGARANFIGGGEPFEGNVIANNGSEPIMNEGGGILVEGHNSKGNKITGNYIGTTLDGLDEFPNADFGIAFVFADANEVGGSSPGERNVISGNVGEGILISGNGIADGSAPDNPQGQLIQGNFIGTDREGLRDVGNGGNGILIRNSSGNIIGASDFAGGGNLISGNDQNGVQIEQDVFGTFHRNDIMGNRIGTDLNDQFPLGLPNEGHGIALHGGADTLVKSNRIAYNGWDGVFVGEFTDGNQITRNSISFNSALGINLMGGEEDAFGVTANDTGDGDSGANKLTNFPVITEVRVTPSVGGLFATVRGTYDNGPGSAGPIEVFTTPACDPSGHGEGETFLARHFRRSEGRFTAFAGATGLGAITATSSLRELNLDLAHTSEFSTCSETSPPPPSYLVINEIDAVPTGQEFIELASGGDGGVSLTGKVLVLYDGSSDTSYASFDLDGQSTDADGFFVSGNAGVPKVALVFDDGLLSDGPAAAALYDGDDTDFPNGTSVTTDNLIDAVVYGTAGAPDAGLLVLLEANQPQVDEASAGGADGDSLQRCPDSSGGERFTDTYRAVPPTPGDQNTCLICYFEPEQTAAAVGEDILLVATVLVDAITPIAGIDVDFEVITGPNAGEVAADTTDANGEAEFTYAGSGFGDDGIRASGDDGGVPFRCTSSVGWTSDLIFKNSFEREDTAATENPSHN